MRNHKIRAASFLALLLLAYSPGHPHASESNPKILFLFAVPQPGDQTGYRGLPDKVILISNMLGHFKPQISHVPIDKYFPGLMKNYDFIFYLGLKQETVIPESFLADIPKFPEVKVVWIRWNLEQLLNKGRTQYGFSLLPPQSGFKKITYNGQVFDRPDAEMIPPLEITDWNQVNADGILQNEKGFTPFAVQSANLWYFPDAPYYGVSQLVFADMLHKLFQMPHPVKQRFFVRLEDIHPLRDPGRLRDNCRVLAKANVPFMMGVIPQYRKSTDSPPEFLENHPHLVQAIKDCASWGGSILLHGYTHQYQAETGEGHEFWDIENDKPIAEYTENTIQEKLTAGLESLTKIGLYPIGWETPHYAASSMNYEVFARHFSTAVEARQLTDNTYKITQNFPFIVQDIYGQTLIPENLGYINFEIGETIEKKLILAQQYKIVQDAVVGVFYHPYYESKYLAKLVEGLKSLGFEPFDLREVPGVALGKNVAVFSGVSGYELFKPVEKMRSLDGDPKILKIRMEREWLHTFKIDSRYRIHSEKWSREKIGGDVVVRIPDDRGNLFVIEAVDTRPAPANRVQGWVKTFILGETNSPVETVQRWVIWSLFLATIFFVAMIIKILITRTSYHSSHFRKD